MALLECSFPSLNTGTKSTFIGRQDVTLGRAVQNLLAFYCFMRHVLTRRSGFL